jgi:hypothetical protein
VFGDERFNELLEDVVGRIQNGKGLVNAQLEVNQENRKAGLFCGLKRIRLFFSDEFIGVCCTIDLCMFNDSK